MALYSREKSVSAIIKNNRYVGAVYRGTQLLWQYIRSCFGRGYWINEKPWSNENGWAN